MKHSRFVFVTLALLTCVDGLIAAGTPYVLWASDPVRPDETLMVWGQGFDSGTVVEFSEVDPGGNPAGEWRAIEPLEISERCVKAVVPPDWKAGVFACRARTGETVSNHRLVNAPDPWWVQGDLGETASPGGWLRVQGKCLTGESPATIVLRSSGSEPVALTPEKAEPWSLSVAVPESLVPGEYELAVRHDVIVAARRVTISRQPQWKQDVFDVRTLGGKIESAVAKAKENGGGIIYLPRGRYRLPGPIELPPGTVLQGEDMALVAITAPAEKQDAPLIKGVTFAVRDLSIYVEGHHGSIIVDSGDSDGVRIERVRIRANSHFMVHFPDKEFRGHRAPESQFVNGAAISFTGRNFQITDCDIYASNRAMWFRGTRDGYVARNKFSYGGRAHGWDHINGLIFEDNEIMGNSLNSIGNDISTFWGKACEHIYYARNQVHDIYGADREMVTLDSGGGAYLGILARVDGTSVTLARDPDPQPKYHWAKPQDWRGGAMLILDGKGAGQYRRIVSHSGRDWEIDAPWEIAPDDTSLVQITYYRGRHLYIDNTFTDGGPMQMYGCAFESIIAGNRGTRMNGFIVQGLNPHGFGFQPSWFCQMLDNQILEGNAYGGRTGGVTMYGGGDPERFAGPMVRGVVVRRNVLHNNAGISIGARVRDVIVENNTVRKNERGITIHETSHGVALRHNIFEDVAEPFIPPQESAATNTTP